MAELKNLDTQYSFSMVSGGSIASSMVLVPQGTNPNQRVGKNILVRRIQVSGHLRVNHTANFTNYTNRPETTLLRTILYLDKQADGAVMAAGAIMKNPNDIDSLYNLDNQSRFEVIHDQEDIMAFPWCFPYSIQDVIAAHNLTSGLSVDIDTDMGPMTSTDDYASVRLDTDMSPMMATPNLVNAWNTAVPNLVPPIAYAEGTAGTIVGTETYTGTVNGSFSGSTAGQYFGVLESLGPINGTITVPSYLQTRTNFVEQPDIFQKVSIDVPCRIPIVFSGPAGTIADVADNNIGLMFINNQANSNSGFYGYARIMYED